jgi:hypothetical protein
MDPVLKNAAREARVAVLLYAVAMGWIVGFGAWKGYGRNEDELHFIWGVPDWVFWAVFVPWFFCVGAAIWFGLRFMKDDDLGHEPREGIDD